MFAKLLLKNKLRIFFALVALLSTFLLFQPTFNTYFFQDDWFSLLNSQVKTFEDFVFFFVPREELIYYRPLGMQMPFFLSQSIFGLNPLPFRIATFVTHIFNGYILYLLLDILLKEKRTAFFGALLYLTSSIHLTIFYWAATFAFVLAPTYFFGGFYLFIVKRYRLSLVALILGLMTNELLVTLPLALTAFLFIERKFEIRRIWVFWLTSGIYTVFRITSSFSSSAAYGRVESVNEFAKSLRNYALWMFHWPEEIHNQFVSFITLNQIFLRDFSGYAVIFTICVLVFVVYFWVFPLWKIASTKKKPDLTLFFFGLCWFVITLSPVLYFENHRYAYYLPIPFAGILIGSLVLFQIWTKGKSTFVVTGLLISLLIVWYFAALKNIEFNKHVHWAPRRSLLSQQITNKIILRYPKLQENSVVLVDVDGNEDEVKWALGDQNAFQTIFQDSRIETFYGSKKMYEQINGEQSEINFVEIQ